MKIHYVANVRLPSERANAYQILSQCDALTELGADVTMIAPRRRNPFRLLDEEIPAYYGLRHAPRIERLFTLDWIDRLPVRWQRAPFVVQSLTFAWAVRRRLARDPGAVVYSRDPWTLALLAGRGDPVGALFYEAHDLPVRDAAREKLRDALCRARGVVAITAGLRDDLVEMGVPGERIGVLPDGFDPSRFRDQPDRESARRALSLPLDAKLAVYTGHLFPWKGADGLVEAAARSKRFIAILVGGREEDRQRVQARIDELGTDRVRLLEAVEPMRVPAYLAAADVLVLPNSSRQRISERYTSPLKLFEYMAAGRPIVASDLPSIGEILRAGENAELVTPDDPDALRAGIERCLDDAPAAASRAAKALEEAERYTWDERARRLVDFVERRLGAKG